MKKKLLDFNASISDVSEVNRLFSTCKVRVLYTGKNRNMSLITKDAVERALPSLKNIPIVGEFSEENKDYKGHGGKIDIGSYKYIQTTKPYGVVPESATYSWEDVKGTDGIVRQYLSIEGCYLWTGRYEEAYSIVERGKGQSMEIEVTNGQWNEKEEAYQIDDFTFSALCILGDDIEPAFEDANITAYSLNKDAFKHEFNLMMNELKDTLNEKEGNDEMLKELLTKYSTTVEELTTKGLVFNEISEDELESEIVKILDVEIIEEEKDTEKEDKALAEEEVKVEEKEEIVEVVEEEVKDSEEVVEESEPEEETVVEEEAKIEESTDAINNDKYELLVAENARLKALVEDLESFKLNTLKEKEEADKQKHEESVEAMFSNFQLTEEEVKDINIHEFSIKEIEEKCYAIIGRKMATKKNFSKQKEENGIRLQVNSTNEEENFSSRYGDLFSN